MGEVNIMGEIEIDPTRNAGIKMSGGNRYHVPLECQHCSSDIDMTDVEGHYSGVCKRCRQHIDDLTEESAPT